MRKFLLSILFCLIAAPAFATAFYVDNTNGSDSNNGLTLASAFQTMAPVTGVNFLHPGDHVEIVGNNKFTGTAGYFTINSSGTQSNPIVIEEYQVTGGTNPIFSGATPTSAVAGWTGWTAYETAFYITNTSATTSVNATYTNNGNTYTVVAAASSATHIHLTGLGSMNTGATLVNATCPNGGCDASITFSADTVLGNSYVSNVTVPFTIYGVIVDGSYNLLMADQGLADFGFMNYRYYQSGGYVYVSLPDNSSPGGHTIEFTGQYQTNANLGMISTNGNYINFNNIEVYGGTTYNWFTPNKGIHIDNSSGYFSGRENLYCATYFQAVGCYNSTFNNDIFEYSNGGLNTGGAWGQNVTIEGSYDDIKNTTIAYGGMAGLDFLNYEPSTNIPTQLTPSSYDRAIGNTIFQNSRRSLQGHDASGFDPQLYCDGCNNFQLISNNVSGNANNQFSYPVTSSTSTSQNDTYGLQLSTEHPTTCLPHDGYIYNNTVSSGTISAITTTVLSGTTTPWYNVWVIGNTFFGNSNDGGFLAGFNHINPADGSTLHVYNNIFYQNSSSTSFVNYGSSSYPIGYPDVNNNIYYNSTNSSTSQVISYNGTAYDVAAWQSLSSEDTNSIYGNPYIVSTSYPYDFHLQRTSLGQSNTSNAIGIGLGNYANQFFNIYNLGTTRTDGTIDSSTTPDAGYHYSLNFGASLGWNQSYGEQYN